VSAHRGRGTKGTSHVWLRLRHADLGQQEYPGGHTIAYHAIWTVFAAKMTDCDRQMKLEVGRSWYIGACGCFQGGTWPCTRDQVMDAAGHGYPSWCNACRAALQWLYPVDFQASGLVGCAILTVMAASAATLS
jgi:hypothetical protein